MMGEEGGEDDFWKCVWEMNRLYRYRGAAPP